MLVLQFFYDVKLNLNIYKVFMALKNNANHHLFLTLILCNSYINFALCCCVNINLWQFVVLKLFFSLKGSKCNIFHLLFLKYYFRSMLLLIYLYTGSLHREILINYWAGFNCATMFIVVFKSSTTSSAHSFFLN